MVGATILSVTLVPVLCSLLIGGKIRGEERNPIMRPLVWLYRPVLDFALRHRAVTLGIAVITVAGALALVPRIGKEFMPPLDEGDLMFMPVTDPSISLPQAIDIAKRQNAAIGRFPEVASVVAKIARSATFRARPTSTRSRSRARPTSTCASTAGRRRATASRWARSRT